MVKAAGEGPSRSRKPCCRDNEHSQLVDGIQWRSSAKVPSSQQDPCQPWPRPQLLQVLHASGEKGKSRCKAELCLHEAADLHVPHIRGRGRGAGCRQQ